MFLIQKAASAEVTVNKSRFIAFAVPFQTVDEFKKIHDNLRKQYRKARHIVYAYRVGGMSKSSDDREPKGTAGRPLLELLTKREINDVALFVVRFFGGIKLGAGRLLRTYVGVANLALNKAVLKENE